ncbi:ABC transporter substrate-binding protein [Kitasatospora sp. NPDC058201]|uniref:ABC transporter substrate-binding protein n=1 Tax=unclassified Kitasatospora TaxID=2633591 RepID=UPI00366216A2
MLELGNPFAASAAEEGLRAPFWFAAYGQMAANQKDRQARWYNSYGGYVTIGCEAARVKVCPASFADLLKPEYKSLVAMNGANPNTAGSAFAVVYAAASPTTASAVTA